MALGFSGSNGGIGDRWTRITVNELDQRQRDRWLWSPLEVSYFINNVCNLKCQHCYVAYERKGGALPIEHWQRIFGDCLALGALTFGNVGKEPLLSWDATLALLRWFQSVKAATHPALRYGLVTNATLLNETSIRQMDEADVSYLDISLDGSEAVHDGIRGAGTFRQSMDNIARLPERLKHRVFISFTAHVGNLDSLPELCALIRRAGVRHIMVSPYVPTVFNAAPAGDQLATPDAIIANYFRRLLDDGPAWFTKSDGLCIYFKNDYTTSRSLMTTLAKRGVLDLNNLLEDEYGTIFSHTRAGEGTLFTNYQPFDPTIRKALRISHDGRIGNCYDMFFPNFPQRARGDLTVEELAGIYEKIQSGERPVLFSA